ncbi:MAG: hypothetical protein RID07_21040 [Lacipirellulaceae bacterium]
MSFVVDGAEWKFDDWAADEIVADIEAVLEFVETSRERGEVIYIGEDFQRRAMLDGKDLWSIASRGGDLNLPSEVVQELAAWLGRAPCYLDQESWPDGLDNTIAIDGGPDLDNLDVAWAHHSVRANSPVGCLGLRTSGIHETRSATGLAKIFWVRTEEDRLSFWRNAIILTGDSHASLRRFAPHAYPYIYFHSGALDDANTLGGGYLALRENIRECLGLLNDYGRWVFTAPPPPLRPSDPAGPNPNTRPSNQIIQARFRGYGFDVAPENPNVFLDNHCRRAREIKLGERTIYCEWHVKLELHRNRIHLHAPISESGEKLIVAIIREHLPLP